MLSSSQSLDGLLQTCDEGAFIVWHWNPPMFYAYKSRKSFFSHFISQPQDSRNYCETVGTRRQKPHFDVDIKPEDLSIMQKPEDIINELCFAIMRVCEEIKLENIHIYSSNSAKNNKYSYHIVINGWYHDDNLEAKRFYDLVIDEMPKDAAGFVDHSVYKSVQQFRMLYNSKPAQGRYKEREHQWIYFGERVAMGPIYGSDYQEFKASLLTCISGCQHLELPVADSLPARDDDAESKLLTDLSLDYLEHLVPKEYILDRKTGKKPYGYRLKRVIRPAHCVICNVEHATDTPGDNARLFIKENQIFMACFRDKNKNHYLLDTIDDNSLIAREQMEYLEQKGLVAMPADEIVPLPHNIVPTFTSKDLHSIITEAKNYEKSQFSRPTSFTPREANKGRLAAAELSEMFRNNKKC